jgi:putative ABC transport system permease protein
MNSLSMAWRNLWRHPVRSGLILLSVAIGFSSGLFVLAVYQGMIESRFRTVIDSEVGHVQFHASGFKPDLELAHFLPGSSRLLEALEKDPLVRAFGTRSVTEGMLTTTLGTTGIVVQGVDFSSEDNLSKLSNKLIEGNIDTYSAYRRIVIGKKLADKQQLRLGSTVVLLVVDSSGELVSAAFRIGGLFRSSNAPFDLRNVYIDKTVLNELLGIGEQAHECVVLLKKDDSTDIFVSEYQKKFPMLVVEGWRTLSSETDLLISAVDGYAIIVLSLIFVALSFGIINTLLMSVLERTREFGMVMALGMNRARVFLLVMWETILLVLGGLPAGGLIAWWVIDHFRSVGIDFSKRSPDLMRSFGFESVLYPFFPARQLFPIAVIVFATTVISALFPAWRVLRLRPADAMRK